MYLRFNFSIFQYFLYKKKKKKTRLSISFLTLRSILTNRKTEPKMKKKKRKRKPLIGPIKRTHLATRAQNDYWSSIGFFFSFSSFLGPIAGA